MLYSYNSLTFFTQNGEFYGFLGYIQPQNPPDFWGQYHRAFGTSPSTDRSSSPPPRDFAPICRIGIFSKNYCLHPFCEDFRSVLKSKRYHVNLGIHFYATKRNNFERSLDPHLLRMSPRGISRKPKYFIGKKIGKND